MSFDCVLADWLVRRYGSMPASLNTMTSPLKAMPKFNPYRYGWLAEVRGIGFPQHTCLITLPYKVACRQLRLESAHDRVCNEQEGE